MATYTRQPCCSIWRRLASISYDSILLFCVVFIAWQPIPLLSESLPDLLGRVIRLSYLLTVCFIFLGWFWTHGGQTLGMKSWKIKLIEISDTKEIINVSWHAAWLRFLMAMISWAICGLGFIWSVFNDKGLAWHDTFSNTRLVHLKEDPTNKK
jgi:uncharacterized RDD family membrane protein YckC